ncbi:hypothetical protein DQ04_09901030 [Trypanosoma grayi]|uniref:hypothetical protein n=1 Tax=Trypanosoma grayi TaxID=71804 RepID=UPI0004F3F7EF|nr:hypothetical protein DQ04_09901030 [Trypanosoma grayi]KEG07405.1 hypothetical protein DQ04_09901030 [Trypanosoma grayi]
MHTYTHACGGEGARQTPAAALEIAERLHVALAESARRLYAEQRVSCSLALLPTVALEGMPSGWGMMQVVPQQQNSFELVVGLGAEVVGEALTCLLCEKHQLKQQQQQHEERQQSLTHVVGAAPPLLGPLVEDLTPETVALALLLLPAHDGLWNRRRRYLSALMNDNDTEESCRQFALLRELLLTSLLLSCHHKKQEVWVQREWVVRQLLARGIFVGLEAFHWHDRVMLLEAADKHPMNYNAWNYRRRVIALLAPKKEEEEGGQEDSAKRGIFRLLLLQESDTVLRFFEAHNGDTSAASYLIFLLQQVTAADSGGSAPQEMWQRLLAATACELRRHCDKGHEAVWVLRLALMHWGLRERPPCGWRLRDELGFAAHYATASWAELEEEEVVVTWEGVAGSHRWASYHAARYGLQLLQLLETA